MPKREGFHTEPHCQFDRETRRLELPLSSYPFAQRAIQRFDHMGDVDDFATVYPIVKDGNNIVPVSI